MRYSNTGYFYKFNIILLVLIIFILIAIPGFTAEKKKNIKALKPSIQACEYVASQANKGQLQNILLKTTPDNSHGTKVPESISGTVFKRIMDINNDGVMERVFVESQGTAHFEDVSVYKLTTDEQIEMKALWNDNWSDDEERWAADRAFVEYKGVTYVLGKTDQSLSYLLYINPSNEMQVVCEFGQREKPLKHLKKSRNDKVCKQALNDQINYVEYNKLHSLSYNEVCNAGFRETHPGDKAALIDIDNDGKKELIASLNLSSGSGRGCESTFPAVLTGDRTSIDKGYIDKLPFGRCGGTEVNPFIIDGKTYLDERQPGAYAEHRKVYMLNKNKLETICEFEVRPINYVLSPVERIKKNIGDKDIWEYAIAQPGTETTEMLIKAGEDINKTPYSSPLMIAVKNKRIDIVEILLKAGADPNVGIKDDFIGWPLVAAVNEGALEAAQLLLKYGAGKNEKACSAAFMWANSEGSIKMLDLLLDNGIPIPDDRVAEAVRNGNHKALKRLIARGLIDLNRKYTEEWPGGIDIKEEAPGVLSINSNANTKPIKITKTLMEFAINTVDIETLLTLKEETAKQGNNKLPRHLNTSSTEAYVMPDEIIDGLSQAEWSWRYWEWSKSFPKGQGPADDHTESICRQKQSGPVFMLTGSNQGKPIKRSGEVPAGKHFFLPVLVSLAEQTQVFNSKELMRIIQDTIPKDISSIYVEIDGKIIADMKPFRQTSGCYFIDTYAGKTFAASDGYWLMLRPLAPGKHTIRFGGRSPDGFSQDVHYELLVKE
jgi:ankyrin repeat protein